MKTDKAQLAARRRELRAEMARRRAAARDRLPKQVGDDRRKRRRRLLLLLLLLLVLLLALCCGAPEPPPPVAEAPAPVVEAVAAPPAVPDPPAGKIPKRKRPPFQTKSPEPLPWLDAFRLQVAARSPRLAECFTGAERPGALKWTAAVEPHEGRVSDQTLDPTLASDGLTAAQRACVLGVLAEPRYALEAGEGPATPSRVGMVIEF